MCELKSNRETGVGLAVGSDLFAQRNPKCS